MATPNTEMMNGLPAITVAPGGAPQPPPSGLVGALGRGWERIKVLGIVLWPVRFIVLVLLAVICVLSLSQGKDALYGAVVEETNWRSAAVFGAVTAWALQSWYWARFLFRRSQLRRLAPPIYHSSAAPLYASAATLANLIPRFLGAAAFWVAGLFIYLASCTGGCTGASPWTAPLWCGWYVLSGIVLLVVTRPGVAPPPPGPIPVSVTKLVSLALIIWFGLLALTVISALWEFPPSLRQSASLLVVGVLFAMTLTLAIKLPLPRSTRWTLVAMATVNSLLFAASIVAPDYWGGFFGPAIVLMLTAGLWVGALSFFAAYPGEALRIPVTMVIVLAAIVFTVVPRFVPGWLGYDRGDHDNHQLRLLPQPVVPGSTGDDARVQLADAFKAWKDQAPCIDGAGSGPCVKPMILVMAQGGASRSGYWVASVLGALEDGLSEALPADKAHPFHRSVFAISGVSGGSLGAAVYQRLVARKLQNSSATIPTPLCSGETGASESFALCGRRVLARDFLGPVFFSMFNADLMQRLIPGDLMPDRAEALEKAWERTWRDEIGSDEFAQSLLSLRRGTNAAGLPQGVEQEWLPVLLLNGASVKTGRRIMTADVAFDPECRSNDTLDVGPDLPSTVDFFCLTRRHSRVSTAVHNSARFPYISPAGTLWARDGADNSWKVDRIVDGGYVEAQGATTLLDLLRTLSGKVPGWQAGVLPILINIENDPPEVPPSCSRNSSTAACQGEALSIQLGDEARTMNWVMQIANDVLAPVIGLADSRTGRGAYAARALEIVFYYGGIGRGQQGNGQDGNAAASVQTPPARANWPTFRFNLSHGKGPVPAMSWYLSRRSRTNMDNDLCADPGGSFSKLGPELGADQLFAKIATRLNCKIE